MYSHGHIAASTGTGRHAASQSISGQTAVVLSHPACDAERAIRQVVGHDMVINGLIVRSLRGLSTLGIPRPYLRGRRCAIASTLTLPAVELPVGLGYLLTSEQQTAYSEDPLLGIGLDLYV